jgi:hypothetical protein
MVKTILKITFATVVYTILFIMANALLPFSQGFKELGSSDPMASLFFLFSSAFTCFTIYFIIKNTNYSGMKLLINLFFVMFFVQYFMTQIETLLFNSSFEVLTKTDVILIMLAGLVPLLAVVPLLNKLFQNKNTEKIEQKKTKNIFIKLCAIGIIYLCIYMVFGYFVAWQFEAVRLFYSGSTEKLSFFGKMANNIKTNPIIFPYQIIRGILFGLAIIPIKKMVTKSRKNFVTSVCLIYLCTTIVLIVPNVLFPDMVRYGHLVEMGSSMLLFGIIVGNILWEK